LTREKENTLTQVDFSPVAASSAGLLLAMATLLVFIAPAGAAAKGTPSMTVRIANRAARIAGPKVVPPGYSQTEPYEEGVTQTESAERRFDHVGPCQKGLGFVGSIGCRLFVWSRYALSYSDGRPGGETCEIESWEALSPEFVSVRRKKPEGPRAVFVPYSKKWKINVGMDTTDTRPPIEYRPC
jgi:hypothetical protein